MKFVVDKNNVGTLKVPQRFTFNDHKVFRSLTQDVAQLTTVIVDFLHCDYLDSSALGMLLMLRDRAREVVLINATGDVSTVLDIANFAKLFAIRKN